MGKSDKCFAFLLSLASLAVSTPAHASDFTGIVTALASAYGVVFVWCAGLSWAISKRAKTVTRIDLTCIFGIVSGIVLTGWWLYEPIAEVQALTILILIPIMAHVVASGGSKAKSDDPDA